MSTLPALLNILSNSDPIGALSKAHQNSLNHELQLESYRNQRRKNAADAANASLQITHQREQSHYEHCQKMARIKNEEKAIKSALATIKAAGDDTMQAFCTLSKEIAFLLGLLLSPDLDPQLKQEILATLRHLLEQRGTITGAITHDNKGHKALQLLGAASGAGYLLD